MTRTKDSTLCKECHFSKNIHERHELVKTKSLWLLFTLPSLKTDKESIPWSPFPQREKTASEKTITVFSWCPIWVPRWTRNRSELPTQMPTKRFHWGRSQREKKTTPNSTDPTTYRRVEKTHQGCLSPLAEHWVCWTVTKRRWLRRCDCSCLATRLHAPSLNTKKTKWEMKW